MTREDLAKLRAARLEALNAAEDARRISLTLTFGSDAYFAAIAISAKLYNDVSSQRYGLDF